MPMRGLKIAGISWYNLPVKILIAAAALITSLAVLAGCGGNSHSAQPRACKVARLIVKDMAGGAVNGGAMGTYASSLAYAARQSSVVQGQARTASGDALAAQQDVASQNYVTYKADANRFVTDLQLLVGECKGLGGSS